MPIVDDSWKQVLTDRFESEHFIIYSHPSDASVNDVVKAAEDGYSKVNTVLGKQFTGKCQILIFKDLPEMSKLEGCDNPKWVKGCKGELSDGPCILLVSPSWWNKENNGSRYEQLWQTVPHEVLHYSLRRLVGSSRLGPFEEGAACYIAGQTSNWTIQQVNSWAKQGRIVPFEDFMGKKSTEQKNARALYAETGLFMKWLCETYGDEKFRTLLLCNAEKNVFDEVYKKGVQELENEWLQTLPKIELPKITFGIDPERITGWCIYYILSEKDPARGQQIILPPVPDSIKQGVINDRMNVKKPDYKPAEYIESFKKIYDLKKHEQSLEKIETGWRKIERDFLEKAMRLAGCNWPLNEYSVVISFYGSSYGEYDARKGEIYINADASDPVMALARKMFQLAVRESIIKYDIPARTRERILDLYMAKTDLRELFDKEPPIRKPDEKTEVDDLFDSKKTVLDLIKGIWRQRPKEEMKTLETEHFIISHYEGDTSLQDVAAAAEKGYEINRKFFGVDAKRKIKIKIFRNLGEFSDWTGQDEHLWVKAYQYKNNSEADIILVSPSWWGPKTNRTSYDRLWWTLPHETVHYFSHEISGGTRRLRALEEGIANYIIERPHEHYVKLVSDAFKKDNILPLREVFLTDIGSKRDPTLFYAEGEIFARWLAVTYGEDKLREIIVCKKPIPEVFDYVFKKSLDELEKEWIASLKMVDWPMSEIPPKVTESEHFVVYCQEGEIFLDEILEAAENGYAINKKFFGIDIKDKIRLIIFRDPNEMAEWSGDPVKAWAHAELYRRDKGVSILVLSPSMWRMGSDHIHERIRSLMPHEVTHRFSYEINGGRIRLRALEEGIANHFVKVVSPRYDNLVRKALEENRFISLAELFSIKLAYVEDAQLHYAESMVFVKWLAAVYGEEKLRDIVLCKKPIPEVFDYVFKKSLDELEKEWIASLS